MHKSGLIHLHNDIIHLQTVLFDSGAIQSNYIDEQFVNNNIVHLKPFLQPLKHSVKLGDNKTQLQLSHIITITVSFIDSTLKSHEATINCSLMPMPGTTLIIGLPTILFHFFDLFTDLLRQAQKTIIHSKKQPEVSLSSHSPLNLSTSSLINTWTLPQDIIASEDTETPQPCSFTGPLYYLGKPYLEAVQQYKDLISTHVSSQFLLAVPDLTDFLTSDIALSVFVPEHWTGITGITPIDLQFSEQLPLSLRPKARPVNPSLYDNAEKEFKRLQTYFYVPSDSSIASCLVIAPKATAPFIRLCGDYVTINRYISTGHYYIPNVQNALTKASGYSVFIDLDWTNSFHQIPISEKTSNRLSIQTPWGLVRPIFVPEGVGPASGILQKCVMDIFSDFDSWTIAIFDNLLILAHSYTDAYDKFRTIIQRCHERHVVLKFSKSWLGFDTVTFFGYLVRKGTFEMSNDRKMAISNIPMPSNVKLMQRFLGTALFFQRFLPNYSELTAPFHDMTTTKFDWNPLTWTIDYNSLFIQFKQQLMSSVALHFPNYSLQWILRSDASSIACAAVLLQITTTGIHQPLAFLSKKFSDSALNWDIHKKEAYAIYYGVQKLEFLLRPTQFILETDHANLLYMEQNTAPIITRWRVYLQSFNTQLRSIPGKHNNIADWMSRQYSTNDSEINNNSKVPNDHSTLSAILDSSSDQIIKNNITDPDYYFSKVHGGVRGHPGSKRTWTRLNNEYKGHNISFTYIADKVASCPTCQKIRLNMVLDIKPIIKSLNVEHTRSRIGIDTLTVTPADKNGNTLIIVVVEHFSKFSTLYPADNHSADTLATCLFQHFCRFGLFDQLISDPGSDLMSHVVIKLNKWFGIDKLVSLVDRHQSNGVEPTNKSILRHLRALIFDYRVTNDWSDPTIIALIEHFLNSAIHSETNLSPIECKFGSYDATYFKLPLTLNSSDSSSSLLKKLNKNLQIIRNSSHIHQQLLTNERTKNNLPQNIYQNDDYVLHLFSTSNDLPYKLYPKYSGPFRVVSQLGNDVTCKNIITDSIKIFHVSRLKLFNGTSQQAYTSALRDNNQYSIHSILAYRGNPLIRTSMSFHVKFDDDTTVWKTWNNDLYSTVPYESYCRSLTQLHPLLTSVSLSAIEFKRIKNTEISLVVPGDTVYVDLRSYGFQWYSSLNLPDSDYSNYIVMLTYTSWFDSKHLKINGTVSIFNEHWCANKSLTANFVYYWGHTKIFDSSNMTLIDLPLLTKYPQLSPLTRIHLNLAAACPLCCS
jgi:hypothetical protein